MQKHDTWLIGPVPVSSFVLTTTKNNINKLGNDNTGVSGTEALFVLVLALPKGSRQVSAHFNFQKKKEKRNKKLQHWLAMECTGNGMSVSWRW